MSAPTKTAQRDARREVVQTSRTKGARITFFTSPKGDVWWTDTYTARPAPEALACQLDAFELPATLDVKVGKLTRSEPGGHPKPGAVAKATELLIRRLARTDERVRLKPTGKRFDNGAGFEVVELRGQGVRELLDARDDDLLGTRLLAERGEPIGRRPRPLLATTDDGVRGLAMGVLTAGGDPR